ncbi:MAG: glycosyltransferase family 39 protein [Chloroflexi bacterium]|nr:glycosyltransferase family 39 protein [Chloroflexota bacterium]
MTEKRWLALILSLFIVLGFLYAINTPVFEASDELWHYPMIRHLADGNELPVQVFDPALAGPWKQEASQPPLYYYVAAALTFWIDTADMETIRWENPHVDNGVITADGNINLTIHNPDWNPWQGTLLAVRIVRFFSVLLGAVTVLLTYLIAKEAVPDRPEIWLGAAAVNAFLPMFLFISASVNNDNLAIMLASLAIWLMIRTVTRRTMDDGRQSMVNGQRSTVNMLLIGVVIGLGLLTKEGTFGLLPIALGTAFVSQWQVASGKWQVANGKSFWRLLTGVLGKALLLFGVMLLPALLIAGWWYGRNVVLYGDWLGWSAFIAVLGQRAHPASLAQLWSERHGFMMAYWGLFGGVNVPMPGWIYTVLNGVLVVSVVGFVVYVVREIRDWGLGIGVVHWNLQSLISNLLALVIRYFGLVVCLLFSTAVIVGLVQWATTTWSSQGRLVFTALSALSVLLAVGLVGWLPRKTAVWVVAALGSFMLTVAALVPFLWIRPSYQPNRITAPRLNQEDANLSFGETVRLAGVEVAPNQTAVQPGDMIDLLLEWEMLADTDRDWSVFVHLNDPVLGVPIAQRDMFLDHGLRPTSLAAAGERIFNQYQLRVPDTAVAPADLELTVGLYDFYMGERLSLPSGEDTAVLDTLHLETSPGETPNPISISFEEGFELVGYELNPRRVGVGGTIEATLYWRLNQAIETDYTFFAQVVGEDTTRWAAQDLPVPTSQWKPGTVQPVPIMLTLRDDVPADVYPLIVGLYTISETSEFERLQRITADGRPTDDFLELTLIKVD